MAKAQGIKLSHRIIRAGADAVVSPQFIGGMRLVSEMVHPTVVSCLDLMLRDMDKAMRVEEAAVRPGSELAGTRLADRIIARSNVLVMALKEPGGDKFLYVPPSDALLRPGCTLVVLGETDAVAGPEGGGDRDRASLDRAVRRGLDGACDDVAIVNCGVIDNRACESAAAFEDYEREAVWPPDGTLAGLVSHA